MRSSKWTWLAILLFVCDLVVIADIVVPEAPPGLKPQVVVVQGKQYVSVPVVVTAKPPKVK
jgi:hypothetical protein